VEGSIAFYGGVFGWTARESSLSGGPYVLFEHSGRTVAGMQPMAGREWPADLPPHWMIYFSVVDCDRTADAAYALGGRVVRAPRSFAMGRAAVLEDPQGGAFSILSTGGA
jgi:predicted enzyme related to lactoylglutathione lyase